MNSFYQNIVNRLKQTNKKQNSINSLTGLIKFLLVLSISVLFFVLIESIFHLSSLGRTILVVLFLVINFVSLVALVFFPLSKNLSLFTNFDLNRTAKFVGEKNNEIKDELLNAVQLVNDKSNNYSKELIEAAFKKVYEKTEQFKFTGTVKFNNYKLLRSSSIVMVFTFLLLFAVPFINNAATRIVNYEKEFIVPPKYSFTIDPGNVDVTKGEDVRIKVSPTSDIPPSIELKTKTAEQAAFESTELQPDSTGNFNYTLRSLNSSTQYFVHADEIVTDTYEIDVISRPAVRKLELNIQPPSYTKLESQKQIDNGSATVLPGTQLDFAVTSTKPLNNAKIKIDEKEIDLDVAQFEARGRLTVKEELNYTISLIDTSDIENENPVTYSIEITEDLHPQIEIVKPGGNVELGLENILPLEIEIADDFGFSSLVLNYQISSSSNADGEFKTQPITFTKSSKEQRVNYSWNIAELNLKAEETAAYFVEVADNDNINGPKKTKSKIFTIRVPSLQELFANADQKQNEAEVELTRTLEEAKQLGEEMQKINNELKKDQRQITFEEKEKIQKAMEKFEELGSKVDEIKQKLDEVRKDLADNNLLSEETLQKYNELQELMDQFSTEEMKQAFEKMREQLDNLMRNQVQEQMEEMQFNEEMFKKSIERTVNLLKRIQIEQKMDEVLKRAENLSEQLEEVNKETEQSDLSDENKNEELSNQQESLNQEFENLEKEMEELGEKMSQFDDMPKEDAENILQQMQEQNNQELSEQASEQIKQSQKQMAMQSQQQMMENMQMNMQSMETMQDNMRMQSQMKVMGDMMKTLDDLLTLSKEEEELKNETRKQSQSSSGTRENTQKQNQIRSNLDKLTSKLSELSQKSFAITPEMGRALGEARREMNQAMMNMQNNNPGGAAQLQERAMKNMNEAAMMMKNSLEQMMSGEGQGGGMMSMMQQLQQMSQQQMSLNQMTQMLNQGKLTQQQMAQMQRLAQEQQMIQKSLAQLNEEAKSSGQSKKLSSNLDEILKEMEEVVTGMRTEKVDDELVQKQERILSKLLDAQRSINERDYEKEREAFAGQDFQRETPPELMLSTEEGLQKLRDELLNVSREGYKKDYEDLIKRYFEALQKEKTSNK